VAGRHVLVVDDDADNREALRALLEMWGYRVDVAEDGEQAITMMFDMRPDVVLLDIVMPGLDGYEVARRIRSASGGATPYLIALTGMGRAEDRRRVREAGFDTYVLKPAETDRLEALLAAAARMPPSTPATGLGRRPPRRASSAPRTRPKRAT